MTSDIVLSSGRVRVDITPDLGGRLRQVTVAGTELLAGGDDPMGWGSYPMVPFAGRIRSGRFDFDGTTHELPVNLPPHAIHGVGYTSEWSIVRQSSTDAVLGLDLPTDDSWPFGGRTHQRITVGPDLVRCELTVEAADRAFPASLGWHPWFRKPDAIDFRPEAMYRRDDDGITVDDLVEVPNGPWDDCFVNRHPVVVTVGGVTATLTSNCTDWVVYDEPSHATCIEPQTAPPDAFNAWPRRVEPGLPLSAWYEWRFDLEARKT